MSSMTLLLALLSADFNLFCLNPFVGHYYNICIIHFTLQCCQVLILRSAWLLRIISSILFIFIYSYKERVNDNKQNFRISFIDFSRASFLTFIYPKNHVTCDTLFDYDFRFSIV